jgi:hypothetical protein
MGVISAIRLPSPLAVKDIVFESVQFCTVKSLAMGTSVLMLIIMIGGMGPTMFSGIFYFMFHCIDFLSGPSPPTVSTIIYTILMSISDNKWFVIKLRKRLGFN